MPLSRSWPSLVVLCMVSVVIALNVGSWASGATITVNNTNDAGAGSLRQAIIDAQPGDTIQITATGNIALATSLPVIDKNLTITGSGPDNLTVSGENMNRVFFVESGTVAINDLTIANGRAKGGDGGQGGTGGGGGGLGAGGGLFVNSGANVTVANVSFAANSAIGGNGGSTSFGNGGGGGGGLGGYGGSSDFFSDAGGGGGGSYQVGGDGTGTTGGAGGQNGGGTGSDGANAGANGTAFGGGGGAGGTDPMSPAATGGNGGFGGGGGGGWMVSGDGGFGGGGGGQWAPGTGGTGGGSGWGQEGGGGAGFGGAIFVRQGGNLTIAGNTQTAGGFVNGGTAPGFAQFGDAAGSAMYLHNQDVIFSTSGMDDINISDDISGTGGVVVQGTGTVHVTGVNNYTGGTRVESGVLEGYIRSIHGDIVNNSSVFINDMTDGTYAGNMSGAGNLTVMIAGNSSLTLSGTNSYTGGTWIEMGWLRGHTDSIQGNITNNSHLVFEQNTDGVYCGDIGGTGNLFKYGFGTVFLAGTNNYSGGTTVEEGSLGGTTNSLRGDIENNARLFFDQAVNGSYAGTISGTGALDKLGAGTVTLSGNNTYTGATSILEGKLVVNGSLTNTSSITVANGAELGGSGTLSNLTVTGTVRPGNSIGTLNVAGDYTHSAGATYEVELNDAGQSDLIDATGNAMIQGGSVEVQAAPGTYTAGTTYRILRATNGVSGTFDTISDNLPFFGFQFLYGLDYVDLLLFSEHQAFVTVTQTPNQYAVAANLDTVYSSASGDLATVMDALNVLSAAEARSAFEQIGGEAYANLAAINVDGANLFTDTAFSRTMNFNLLDDRQSPGRELWAYALGTRQRQNTKDSFYGYNGDTGGLMIGCDRQFGPVLVGFGSGYARNDMRFRGPTAFDRTDMFNFSGYGKVESDQAYVAGVVGYTRGWNDVSRTIAFDGLAARGATSSVDGNLLGTLFQVGRHIDHGNWRLTPLAGMRYVYGSMGSTAESGADSLSLLVSSYNRTSLTSHFGGKAAIGLTRRWRAEAYAQWEHEYCDTASLVSMSLTGAPTGFLVQGASFERDGARVGLIAVGQLNYRLSVNVNYDALLRASYSNQQLTGGLSYAF